MNVKRRSVIYRNDQRVSVLLIADSVLRIAEFLLGNNTNDYLSSFETAISN